MAHISPFRYPGGKSWLVPTVLDHLARTGARHLLEPFAGGASVGLAVASELRIPVSLVELDEDVAAVWTVLINGCDQDYRALAARVLDFWPTPERVSDVVASETGTLVDRAFRTIVRNRCQRGGIMAPGTGLMRQGEDGRGIASRWYPQTLVRRFARVRDLRPLLRFTRGDALEAIEASNGSPMFVDPPYSAGNGKRAGKRLYAHHELDHGLLFELVHRHASVALVTYDDDPWVHDMAARHGFTIQPVTMRSAHNTAMTELLLTR